MSNTLECKNNRLTIPIESLRFLVEAYSDERISSLGIEDKCYVDEEKLKGLKSSCLNEEAKEFESLLGAKDLCNLKKSSLEKKIDRFLGEKNSLCNLDFSKIKFDTKADYIPFRILDGHLVAYYQECVGGKSPCKTYPKNHHGQKGFLGTIETYTDSLSGLDNAKNPTAGFIARPFQARQYNINTLMGGALYKFNELFADFPKKVFESLKQGENLVIMGVEDQMCRDISITSRESQREVEAIPMRLIIEENIFNSKIVELQAINSYKKYLNPSSVHLKYEINHEQYLCYSSVVKVMLSENKYGSVDLDIDPKVANEVMDVLSNPEKLRSQITRDLSLESIEVPLPIAFAESLGRRLINGNESFSKNDILMITLDKDSCPVLDAEISSLVKEEAYKILDKSSGFSDAERHEVESGCLILLGQADDYNPEHSEL